MAEFHIVVTGSGVHELLVQLIFLLSAGTVLRGAHTDVAVA